MKNRYSAVREKVQDVDLQGMGERIRAYVQANPGKALLMSIGVGFVVGLMLRRRGDEEEE